MSKDGVVSLFPEAEARIWVCECGCSTFHVTDGGDAVCAVCENVADVGLGAWFGDLSDGSDRDPDLDAPIADVQGNGSEGFARRRAVQVAADPEAVMIVVARSSGHLTVWGDVGNSAQLSWVRRNLDDAYSIFAKWMGQGDG